MLELVLRTIETIENEKILSNKEIDRARSILGNNDHVILSQSIQSVSLTIEDGNQTVHAQVLAGDEELILKLDNSVESWNTVYGLVALYFIEEEFGTKELSEGKKYTREGMIKRVLDERMDRAKKADYKVILSDNLYGEHTLINEIGKSFNITLRDFKSKTGYINNIDWKTNKLGVTKHILFLFNYLEEHPAKTRKLKNEFPFIEIYTDPLNDYKVTWYFPEELEEDERELIQDYFGDDTFIEDSKLISFFSFIQRANDFDRIKIREEVHEKIEEYIERIELRALEDRSTLDFSVINGTLYPYQKDGVAFSVFKKGVIIADEMGLGKTLQAISTAVLKKELFDFKRTLVICPASVKHQWKNEVLKFSKEHATVVEGFPEDRAEVYQNNTDYFHIVNYETVLRDLVEINKRGYDFVILDEAQKIKNYETKTSKAIKGIKKKHALVITGTPLENKLLDIYSIVQFLDQNLLAPQWEFSYQHCIFDEHYKNKIHGYYNLQNLKKRLSSILIRREKGDVFDQLPNVIQKDIYVKLSDEQANLHAGFSGGIARILHKKFKTAYDWQKLMLLLTNMRMVCNSSYLIDKQTNHSPKLVELRHILIERLDIKNSNRKIIIFSEWVTMLNLIGDMLKKEGVNFTMLTGKVPVKKRHLLIKEFEENPDCQLFLSSESGGSGLNLQIADTVINFELPWNPAKKNQRIGRIDRIGQKHQKLHVFNFLSYDSIEMKIATGLSLKQNLFEGVLNENSVTDQVDFSEKGKSQFIKQLEDVIDQGGYSPLSEDFGEEEEEEEEISDETLELQTELAFESEGDNSEKVNDRKDALERPQFEEMEHVMTKGMEFLTGLFEMSTGKRMDKGGKPKVNVNKETGEVSISFKMEEMIKSN